MSTTEPEGVPSGGDALNSETPTSNDATADADTPSGDAGLVDTGEATPHIADDDAPDTAAESPSPAKAAESPNPATAAESPNPATAAEPADSPEDDGDAADLLPGSLPVAEPGPLF